MFLAPIFSIVLLAVAIAAGLDRLSFWWVLIPAFLAASFSLSNGPGYDIIMNASQQGRPGMLPKMLALHLLPLLALAGIVYAITRVLA